VEEPAFWERHAVFATAEERRLSAALSVIVITGL